MKKIFTHISSRWTGSYIDCNGDTYHRCKGKLHREDGPAIECRNGHNEWFLHGKPWPEGPQIIAGHAAAAAKRERIIQFLDAARNGEEQELLDILKEHPKAAAEWRGEGYFSLWLGIAGLSPYDPDNSYSPESPLWQAVVENKAGAAQILIDHGANVNEEYDGKSLLGWAALRGNREIVVLLLKCGADAGTVDPATFKYDQPLIAGIIGDAAKKAHEEERQAAIRRSIYLQEDMSIPPPLKLKGPK